MSINNWNESSILSDAGYTADGSQSSVQRAVRIERAINGDLNKAIQVMNHLKWLIADRGDRMPFARIIWRVDFDYVIRKINSGAYENRQTKP